MQAIEKEVQAAFSSMTDSQKRVAQLVARSPDEVAFLTLEELATRAEVSTTTVLRFARSLGYTRYTELQAKIQEEVRARVGLPQRLSASASKAQDHIFTKAFERDLYNIQTTMRNLSQDALDRFVDWTLSAREVHVIGVRSAFSPAFFTAFVLSQLLGNVHLLRDDLYMLPEQVMNMSRDDVCIAFTFPRYSRVTLDVIKYAKKQNARVIAICDSPLCAAGQLADLVLSCEFEGVVFKSSMVAPLSLANGLVAAVALKARERSMSTLSKAEGLFKEWEYFLI